MQCRHCKEEVAEGAKICKHCGCKPKGGGGLVAKVFLGIIAVSAIVVSVQAITNPQTAVSADAKPEYTGPQSIPPSVAAGMVRDRLGLKDPESAEFEQTIYNEFHGVGVVCGRVNAKNSYGAYTGFKPFMVIGEIASMPDANTSRTTWPKNWKTYCEDFNPATAEGKAG